MMQYQGRVCSTGPSQTGEDRQGQGGWLPVGSALAAPQMESHDLARSASHLQRLQLLRACHPEQDRDLPWQQQALHSPAQPQARE